MSRQSWAILCFAYLFGLLSVGIFGFPPQVIPIALWGKLALAFPILGVILGITVPRFWRTGPAFGVWGVAGLIGAIAVAYLQFRIPQPSTQDISTLLNQNLDSVRVTGQILDSPQINRRNNIRFTLQVQGVDQSPEIRGKLYVTVPLLHGAGLVPRQTVTLIGQIYAPPAADNPGGFNFQAYLARQGIFAGFRGQLAEEPRETPWGWWQLRQRIVRSQVRWLGSKAGSLISSIVLGRKAVELSPTVRDSFLSAGLAHTLAASGFHVSLLLGVMLTLSRNLGAKTRLWIGVGVLLMYLGLTGIQPSVVRAVIMGIAVLVAAVGDRAVKPVGLLFITAIVMLLVNPLWIDDLGFQLSFLATFGLVVTSPAITKRLDFLPPTLTSLIAVPVAASVWTLPLIIYQFKTIALYSIFLNALTTPLIALVSLGGMISAGVALIFPLGGSALAWLLYVPTELLIKIVEWVLDWPFSNWNIGKIAFWQFAICYLALILIWQVQRLQRFWMVVVGGVMALIVIPLWYHHTTLLQVTILEASPKPVIVVQEQDKITLLHTGDSDTAAYNILPFLREQGINHINLALALPFKNPLESGWTEIFDAFKVKSFFSSSKNEKTLLESLQFKESYPLKIGQRLTLDSLSLQVLSLDPALLQFQIGDRAWLFGGDGIRDFSQIPPSPILIWSGDTIPPIVLEKSTPVAVIFSNRTLPTSTQQQLQERDIPFYVTGEVGAVQWTPQRGLESFIPIALES